MRRSYGLSSAWMPSQGVQKIGGQNQHGGRDLFRVTHADLGPAGHRGTEARVSRREELAQEGQRSLGDDLAEWGRQQNPERVTERLRRHRPQQEVDVVRVLVHQPIRCGRSLAELVQLRDQRPQRGRRRAR